jgi:hypothetical protein
MITYSDYVLASKPYAFFRMSDPPVSGFYLDHSGNKHHSSLSASSNLAIIPLRDVGDFSVTGVELPQLSRKFQHQQHNSDPCH